MANEKWNCNQICRWNDPSDRCIKPTYATCPMANTEPDASGWGQVNEKRLIDADGLISRFCELANRLTADNWFHLDAITDEITDAPTVDAVEVVHGRWIDRPSMKGQVYCSECATIEKSTDSNYKSRRCPNCGAKMDGGNEDGSAQA